MIARHWYEEMAHGLGSSHAGQVPGDSDQEGDDEGHIWSVGLQDFLALGFCSGLQPHLHNRVACQRLDHLTWSVLQTNVLRPSQERHKR